MISMIFNLKISYIDIIDNNSKTIGKSIIDITWRKFWLCWWDL